MRPLSASTAHSSNPLSRPPLDRTHCYCSLDLTDHHRPKSASPPTDLPTPPPPNAITEYYARAQQPAVPG